MGYQCGDEDDNALVVPRGPVRHVAPNGEARVLMTNLFDTRRFPVSAFGDLYHRRWRIEEAFKRLKHRLNLEHVTGLYQQASNTACKAV